MADRLNSLCRECDWAGAESVRRCPACGSPRVLTHAELPDLTIAHIDCDAFYASVEKRDAPELRDKPVIVGGGKRGVVTTACYIARLSGVKSAMPMFKARALCPQAIIIKPDFPRYRAESRKLMGRLRDLTPLVQTLSLDEAWLDLSGTQRLHGAAPAQVLARTQRLIEQDLGLTVSVGLAPNRFLAKIASELDKPRGFAIIGRAEAKGLLAPRSVSILPGVGPVMTRSLEKRGFHTVGEIARADRKALVEAFGDHGLRLWTLAQGIDERAVDPAQGRKSLSAETTFEDDIHEIGALETRLSVLCDRVGRSARAEGIAGRTVTLKLKGADFRTLTRRRAAPGPTRTSKTLFSLASGMLREVARGQAWRLIGVGITDLEPASAASELFEGDEGRALKAETAMDALRAKFGDAAVRRARSLG